MVFSPISGNKLKYFVENFASSSNCSFEFKKFINWIHEHQPFINGASKSSFTWFQLVGHISLHTLQNKAKQIKMKAFWFILTILLPFSHQGKQKISILFECCLRNTKKCWARKSQSVLATGSHGQPADLLSTSATLRQYEKSSAPSVYIMLKSKFFRTPPLWTFHLRKNRN